MRVIALVAATAAVAVVAAGCGADGGGDAARPRQVSEQELRRMLEQADREISQSFERVEQASRKDDAQQIKQALSEAAQTERRQIERLEGVRPPKDAEKPLKELLAGARGQVQDLQQLAQREGLSKKALETEMSKPDEADKQVQRALEELSKQGLAPRME